MDSFPAKDLSAEVSRAIHEAYLDGETPRIPDWLLAYDSPDPAVPPERPLTQGERIHGLATVWSEAKYNFAYWDQLPGEAWWDGQFQTYIPLVAAAPDDDTYWMLLQEFGRLLADGHTGVYLPRHTRQAEGQPPARIISVEGRPIVLEGTALPRGTEILAVDGRPAAQVRAEALRHVQSSTKPFTELITAQRLLRGPLDRPVRVHVRLPDGTEQALTLPREPLAPRPPLVVHELGDGICHVAINTMGTDQTAELFHERFPDFTGVRGLILDVRWNGGGSSDVGYSILSRLLAGPSQTAAERMRCYLPTQRAWGLPQRWLDFPPGEVHPDQARPSFPGPVAALSSPNTFSAAEDFLVVYKGSGRGPVIGQASGGSTGQPLCVQLPGGGFFRVCTKRDTCPDGTLFVGRGIQPDMPCEPTIAGMASGRDEVLERAVGYLREQISLVATLGAKAGARGTRKARQRIRPEEADRCQG